MPRRDRVRGTCGRLPCSVLLPAACPLGRGPDSDKDPGGRSLHKRMTSPCKGLPLLEQLQAGQGLGHLGVGELKQKWAFLPKGVLPLVTPGLHTPETLIDREVPQWREQTWSWFLATASQTH